MRKCGNAEIPTGAPDLPLPDPPDPPDLPDRPNFPTFLTLPTYFATIPSRP